MIKLITIIVQNFDKINFELKRFISKLCKKNYVRIGKCKSCGRCCREIYVRHSKDIIRSEEEFKELIPKHFFYSYLEVIDKTDTGLVFRCKNLNEESGKCLAYNKRALLCRQYPVEEIFKMGGIIAEECGFKFIPVQKFEDVLKKMQKIKTSLL